MQKRNHSLGKRNKLITGTKLSEDVARFVGIRFEFLAQLCDVQVDGTRDERLLITPHVLKKQLPREPLAWMGYEVAKKAEFLGGKLKSCAVAENFILAEVDNHLTEAEHGID